MIKVWHLIISIYMGGVPVHNPPKVFMAYDQCIDAGAAEIHSHGVRVGAIEFRCEPVVR